MQVQRITDRMGRSGLSGRLGRELDAILATVTGPGTSFVSTVGRDVQIDFVWTIRNTGESPGRAALRINMQMDGFFGDFSQVIMETDGTLVGALAPDTTIFSSNSPGTVQPGSTRQLAVALRIPSDVLFDQQGTIAGFNWWIGEVTAWDFDKNELAGGDSRFEVRDWFRIEAPAALPAAMEVVGAPGFNAGLA